MNGFGIVLSAIVLFATAIAFILMPQYLPNNIDLNIWAVFFIGIAIAVITIFILIIIGKGDD